MRGAYKIFEDELQWGLISGGLVKTECSRVGANSRGAY